MHLIWGLCIINNRQHLLQYCRESQIRTHQDAKYHRDMRQSYFLIFCPRFTRTNHSSLCGIKSKVGFTCFIRYGYQLHIYEYVTHYGMFLPWRADAFCAKMFAKTKHTLLIIFSLQTINNTSFCIQLFRHELKKLSPCCKKRSKAIFEILKPK